MSVREEKIVLEPMDIIWGSREKNTIQTIADVAAALDGLHGLLSSANDEIDYYFWLDVDAGGNDPDLAGKTGIQVSIATGDLAPVVATALQTALDALDDFNASVVGDLVTVENSQPGTSTLPVDVDSGFTFANLVISKGRDLGGTSGGVEFSFEINTVDVQADQLGEQIADQIINANNLTISMTILELTQENWEILMGEVAGEVVNIGGNNIVGFGESKRFKNMSQFSLEMMMKPVGAADNSRNFHFWKVYPMIDTVSFSGSDLSQMAVTWRALRDTSKDNKYNLFAFGDGTKITA